MATDEVLRREIASLGRMFGEVLLQFEGEAAFNLVEKVRAEARLACEGDAAAGDRLAALLSGCTGRELRVIIKAFSGFLELANLAEDRQRMRVLREKELASRSGPRWESIGAAVLGLRERGLTPEEFAKVMAGIDIELVFTAHPTEAKRKSIRSKVRAIRRLLATLDKPDLLDAERGRQQTLLRGELTKLWQTDLVRPMPPTVMEEVDRGLSFQSVLWDTAPKILGELRDAVEQHYPEAPAQPASVLRFGSWMGGDRDGHPYVTPAITEQTLLWLRRAALEDHQETCTRLIDSISIASDEGSPGAELIEAAAAAAEQHAGLAEELRRVAPYEGVRRWLRVILWRLRQTAAATLDTPPLPGEYADAEQLAEDVRRVAGVLDATGNAEVLRMEVQPWLDQIATFGLQTARLDIRQHAGVYAGVMREVWHATRFLAQDQPLDEPQRQALLLETLPIAPNLSPVGLSADANRTLELFGLLRRIARRFGMQSLGGHVMSMTTHPSDLLTILWLWKWSERVDHWKIDHDQEDYDPQQAAKADAEDRLPVIPLFETIDDLRNATQILSSALEVPLYRENVRALDDRQIVMIGYSDSTKDGGYLSAAWSLQSAQIELFAAAAEHGVDVTFFHGRGGSLGRGGGPAARAIQSLPANAFDGTLRLTEQGEVLAERYDDPLVAHRHLEQVVSSVLLGATRPPTEKPAAWREAMQQLSDASLKTYRRLVDHPSFVSFFRTATPIAGIEGLAIGSRPAKRKKGDRIEDLRAIPWVFSWTQCRSLLPAWYGLGGAVAELLKDRPGATDLLTDMYENWPFFRATIDNSALAVAKSNPPVFRRYAQIAIDAAVVSGDDASGEDAAGPREIAEMLAAEHASTRSAILTITGCGELLDDIPWLQRSIQVRNGYVDPLNFVQIELMKRARAAADPPEEQKAELNRLTQRAIKGVAAGLRTTG
ncbi:MAG: phosphoenolpyruvate carboxylase [Planctomycetota bacterium]